MHAAHDLPVHIVSDDAGVARWATRVGAQPLAPGVSGLNQSVAAAVEQIGNAPAVPARIIIAHADLPIADDLRVVTGSGVAIAPDSARDGSNVLSLPTGTPFTFRYGPGSFAAHREEAEQRGLPFTVIDDPSLALDVDEPADLIRLQEASPERPHLAERALTMHVDLPTPSSVLIGAHPDDIEFECGGSLAKWGGAGA